MKIQIMLQVRYGHDAPEAPEGYRREQAGVCWEYATDSAPDWDSAKATGKWLSEQSGVYNVEVYNVDKWQ